MTARETSLPRQKPQKIRNRRLGYSFVETPQARTRTVILTACGAGALRHIPYSMSQNAPSSTVQKPDALHVHTSMKIVGKRSIAHYVRATTC